MKNLIIKVLSVLLIFFYFSVRVDSQSVQNIDLDKDTLSVDQQIPGVDMFIQSALKNSALLKISDGETQQILERIKIQKKSWSDNLFLEGNARYGQYNQLIVNQQTGAGSIDYGLKTANEQFTYYGGLTVKLPFSDFLNKKSQIKILNYSLEESKQKKEQAERELTSIVIEEYYKLIKFYQVLQVNQNVLQALKITYMKVQKDLANGLIDLNEYTTFLISKAKVEEAYYNAKNDYYTQYRKIQVITGLNLNSKK